jgi:hypothetical protein
MPTEISGSTGVNKIQDNTIVNADINSSAAIANSKLVGAGGITHMDTWRMYPDFSATTIVPITGWISHTGTNVAHIGTAMSHSSGVFTFPTTGIWKVGIMFNIYKAGDSRQQEGRIVTTSNNGGGWTTVSTCDMNTNQGSEGSNVHIGGYCETILDITDTANHKVRFEGGGTASVTWYGGAGRFNVSFMRLGDT